MFAVSRWVEKRLGNLYFVALWPKCNIYIICESGICICIKKAYINQAKTYANICFLTFVDPCPVLFVSLYFFANDDPNRMATFSCELLLVSKLCQAALKMHCILCPACLPSHLGAR